MTHVLARAGIEDLAARQLYELLRLRSEVFVVEQDCVYPDLDGRDLEAGTEHRWAHEADRPEQVLAYLRVLVDPGARRIGRVVTSPAARGRGLAGELVAAVVTEHGPGTRLVLDAQSHLADWYARFGFGRDGDDFVEDGIPHTPMARPAG
ncbi:GNAT family N-acetyltransferase [Jannaschia sp. R86511]|uniref:GNAT family N-acetyltransferase n=1 Tax=Jannaschia sp. R86511 TaxID=3093853 RepID=UPI0036D3854E